MRSSPLAVTVLSLLAYEPLHPYRMQRLMQEWGKDRVVNVGQRANLYKTIKRLLDAGLVAVRQTERDQQYPERTVYELTDEGHAQVLVWLTEMLAVPRNEFPEFPAALSFLMMMAPDKALEVLGARAEAVRRELSGLETELGPEYDFLPRVARLESEYLRAVTAAELGWLEGVVDDLRAGTLSWSAEELAAALADDPSDASGLTT
jgi:DNA-binding PadR family transcriptional regulator